jgi:hypothetical protein
MAIFGRYYQLSIKNADKNLFDVPTPQLVNVRIYDLTLEDDTTFAWDIIEVDGTGDPFHLATVDNSEDKFTPIKPIQATIKILSSDKCKLSSFVNAPIEPTGVDVGDPRWLVIAYYNDYLPKNIIFKGFVNLDDCYEAFLPEKQEIVLVANDGLGGLKNIPLTDFTGSNPKNYNRIADYLTWALSKTGLTLPLKAVFNLREETVSSQHFYDSIYLHAKTFEDKIGVSINCYDVLERILTEEAFLTQRGGEWWIMRVDEVASTKPYYVATFNTDGTFNSIASAQYYTKFIGATESIFFANEATTVHPVRPHKFIKETFSFEYPQEIIDNIDFTRGDENTLLPHPDVVIDGTTYYQRKYNIADWLALEVPTGIIGGTASPSTTNNYIRRLFTDTTLTVEQERYVVIEKSAAKGYYIQSNKFPVNKNDKFDISVDVRWSNDGAFPGSGFYRLSVMQVRLHGNSGTNWILHGGTGGDGGDPNPKWAVSGPSFSHVENFYVEGDLRENMQDWKTASFITKYTSNPHPCPPIPDSGQIEVLLLHTAYGDNTDINFSNLRFKYVPYINGGYPDYTSFYYKISRDENLVNKRDKQVYLSGGVAPLLKGSLFKNVAGQYVSVNQFYAWNDITTLSPDPIYVHPYGHLQAYDVWNQHRNGCVKFQGDMQGLTGAEVDVDGYVNFPHLLNSYFLLDSNENTNDRIFMLLTFDIDFYSCSWKGTLIEVINQTVEKSYLDNLETKYE